MNDPRIDRARVLIRQNRFDMADRELRGALAENPHDSEAHQLLALCLLDQDKYREATEAAQQGVHLAPYESSSHRVLGIVFAERQMPRDAKLALHEAIRLDPEDEVALGMLAAVEFEGRNFLQALQFAERGLAIDPDDPRCLNIRTLTLEKLGRVDDAVAAAEATLERNPEDAFSHTSNGLTLLNAGRYREAQESFAEALRLDPNLDLARQGMIRALNSRSLIFRLVCRFYTAMARLSTSVQWMVVIGLLVGMRVLRAIAEANPAFKPFVIPIVVLYFGFVLLTWIADPLFNTFLRFNRYGRYLLDRDDRMASNLTAGMLLLGVTMAVLSTIGFGLLAGETGWRYGGLYGCLWLAYGVMMLIPIGGTFSCPEGWPRMVAAFASVLLGLLGLVALASPFVMPQSSAALMVAFVIGNFAMQIGCNVLRNQTVAKN